MTVYVVSTQTDSVKYCRFNYIGDDSQKGGRLPILKDYVLIRGGAGLPSIRSGFGNMTQDEEGVPMWTADGVVTPLSDEQYDLVKDHWLFQKHEKEGLVKVLKRDIIGNHKAVKDIVQSDMTKRDAHAQLNPETFKMKIKVTTKLMEQTPDGEFRI
jgi:hypothetical protein